LRGGLLALGADGRRKAEEGCFGRAHFVTRLYHFNHLSALSRNFFRFARSSLRDFDTGLGRSLGLIGNASSGLGLGERPSDDYKRDF
jgi:hypothetical protein